MKKGPLQNLKQTCEIKITLLTVCLVRWFANKWLEFDVGEALHLPKQPFLIVSRHTSYLDGILLGAHFFKFRKVSPVATSGLFQYPSGIILRGAGAIPVRRGQPYHKSTIQLALQRLSTNCVLIFPEGGIRQPLSGAPLKSGFVFLAAKSQAPIVYCHLENAHHALPPGGYWIRRRKVTLRIVQIVSPQDLAYPLNSSRAERIRCVGIAKSAFGF